MIQNAAGSFFIGAAPLFEMKGYLLLNAGISNGSNPASINRSSARPTFATSDYPIYTSKIRIY